MDFEAGFLLEWIAPAFFCRGAFGRNMIFKKRRVKVAARATCRGRAMMASAAGRHGTQGTQPPGRAACQLRVFFNSQLKFFGAGGAFDVSALCLPFPDSRAQVAITIFTPLT